jgi:hypothetical protein
MDKGDKFNKPDEEMIILCQPDATKGCSVCCGLFNFRDISRESLELFFQKGRERAACFSGYEDFDEVYEVRDKGSHICPYQGFLSHGKPGCLLHPLYCGEERRGRSLFSEKICSGFLCPAHSLLSNDEKRALVRFVNDWYLYSVAVFDPLFFSQVYKKSVAEFNIYSEEEMISAFINEHLMKHAVKAADTENVLFSYSVSEYSSVRLWQE